MTTTASDLRSQYDDPWEALADMHTCLGEKDDRIEEQAERINELEAELENQSTNIGGAFAKLSAIDDRLEAVEEREAEVDPDPNADDDAQDQSNETPLEQICSLPRRRRSKRAHGESNSRSVVPRT